VNDVRAIGILKQIIHNTQKTNKDASWRKVSKIGTAPK
jgi:hypothetical protein